MSEKTPYRLGLDLGSSSIGWAIVGLTRTQHGQPNQLIDAGVRIFEAGVEGDIEQGKDSSRAAKRREARLPRRQNYRTQARKRKLFELLVNFGLLPASESNAEARKACLDQLDANLREKHLQGANHAAHQKLTYLLRDMAAETKMEPYEVGRALYALAQHRGFLSNRKAGNDDEEQEGKVKSSITTIDNERGHLTLGQHLNRNYDPVNRRIRNQYLGRNQILEEFERIKLTQQNHLELTSEQWQSIYWSIFFQRPLKSQSHRIGSCDIYPQESRCPLCHPLYQEFRILQKVNDLKVLLPGGDKVSIREIPNARENLIIELTTTAKLSPKQAAKIAVLPKGAKLAMEEYEELDLIGNRTNVKLMKAFGDDWLSYSPEKQEQIVLEVLHYIKDEALKERAQKAWGLSEEAATVVSKTRLEEDYGRLSLKAIRELIEPLRKGEHYSTIRRELFPEQFEQSVAFDKLPPVKKWNREITNPAVIRALTELRKLVNCLVQKHGKPAAIHIELARELKHSKQKRKDIYKKNQDNRKRRENAAAQILNELKVENPSRRDIEKWLLAEECNWDCPYCGGANCGGKISPRSLIGNQAEFNIEHIYPRRYLDDSYTNKTISCRTCNMQKGDRTPAQAFSGERYQEILQRVKRFKSPLREEKLKRFQREKPDDDFVTRHLNDTRYTSRLAADYLGTLFGGKYDQDLEMLRIYTPSGGLTWMLRNGWQLNDILSDTNEKSRDDHRHHAVDAVVVALSDQSRIQAAAKAAIQAEQTHSKPFLRAVEFPWNHFKDHLQDVILQMHVSHRPTRTISGPLHAESIYSKQHQRDGKPDFRIRKALTKLTIKEISGEQIVDPAVRKLVQQKFAELGGKDPSKVFAEEANLPCLPNKKNPSQPIPIRKVRLSTDVKPRSIGSGIRQRHVASGKDSNYAAMIYAELDKNGKEKKWIHEIVTRLEAAERYSQNLKKVDSRGEEKVLIPDEKEGKRRFKFAIRKNDMLLLAGPNGSDVLYRVQSFSKNEIQLCEHNQLVATAKNRTKFNRISGTDNLRTRKAQPVRITPDGDLTFSK